jgi:cytochrome P450
MPASKAEALSSYPSYTPPFPTRWEKTLPVWSLLTHARRNLLSIWPEQAFDWEFFGTRLFLQRVFVANSPDVVQTVFVERAANYHSKSPQQRHALQPLLGDGLFVSDGETWAERRRVIAQVTHVSRMAQLAPVMSEVAGEWADRWAAIPAGTTIDVLSEMAQLTAEIICRSIFGRALKPGTARAVVDAFSDYQAAIAQMDFMSLLGLPDILPRLHGARVRRSAARIRAVVEELVDTILADGEAGGPSLIGAMAAADSPVTGRPMTREAFRNEAIVLFMAGHETTANTLAWAWYLLSQAPWAAAAVQREADALEGRPATHADMGKLAYTQGVIQETLRLYPPVPLQARRAAADDRIRNRAVPKGSLMILIPWLLHRHQRLWERPDAFEPERWLPGGAGAPSRYAYVPFSLGPRVCTGAAFGLTEAVICLATLAARFRLTLAEGHEVQPVARLTLRPGEDLPMVLERR